VIIRILGEAQFEISEANVAKLNELDAAVETALAHDDESALMSALAALDEAVRASGTPLAPATILPSDLVLPHEGSTLGEVKELLASEGANI
jgi:hypothetical protein